MDRAKQKGRGEAAGGRSMSVGVICATTCEREALVVALGAIGRALRVIDCGSGVAESVTRVRDLAVDAVLLSLDPGPAASFAASLRSASSEIRVVAILRSESAGTLTRLAAAGVVGFVRSASGLTVCARTLRAVGSHGFYCPPELTPLLLQGQTLPSKHDLPRTEATTAGLHGRRLEVAQCVASGLANKEIGDRLGIAGGTVKNHVHAVLTALGVEHRWQVAAALRLHASRLGLIRGAAREESK